jgi:hypothetical protein
MRAFVPVKVDAEDGEGRPLVNRYGTHIRQIYPTILFLDPAAEATAGDQVVGKIPGFLPPTSFADRLRLIARLPRDLATLGERHKAHPEDVEALPQLVAALAMQGGLKEAIELATPTRAGRTDQARDRWAAASNVLGHELLFAMKLVQAGEWFGIAAQAAKRPIDRFNAHLGAGFTAALLRQGDRAAGELEAAARVAGIPRGDRAFARELLEQLAQPREGAPAVKEAATALRRLEGDGWPAPGEKSAAPAKGRSSGRE